MSMLFFWPLLGALIGISAGMKRGFNLVGSAIGGILLGPLAFLMFFMSGLVSRSEQRVQCPFCAEFIRPEANVCKHCGKDVPASTSNGKTNESPVEKRQSSIHWWAVVLVFIIAFGFFISLTPAGKTVLTSFVSSLAHKSDVDRLDPVALSSQITVDPTTPMVPFPPAANVTRSKPTTLPAASPSASTAMLPRNPACVKPKHEVSTDAKSMLRRLHPDSFFIQDAVYQSIMESYDTICAMRVESAMLPVFQRVYETHYPNYFIMQAVIENEQKSLNRMR
jgi:hypothetical protein